MAHSIYEDLTRRIIEALKKGRLPWIRPWNTWPLRHNGRRRQAPARADGTRSLTWIALWSTGNPLRVRTELSRSRSFRTFLRQPPARADGALTMCSTPSKSKAFPRASTPHPSAMSQTCNVPSSSLAPSGRGSRKAGIRLPTLRSRTSSGWPRSAWFHRDVDYFATLAHELGHWTGHGKRLHGASRASSGIQSMPRRSSSTS